MEENTEVQQCIADSLVLVARYQGVFGKVICNGEPSSRIHESTSVVESRQDLFMEVRVLVEIAAD